MKLNHVQDNPAVLSNVGEIGEFRIRNSAKAFNILSSGLYANKIRAIIRELSCNAVDSHVADGKGNVPFDVHLPSRLEMWFSIRDYGSGLSHDQVTNIYTTYFESTKTDSNEFIGALGLGSKSPFSYTDNFGVTAIKNGRKGIYSAFINDMGIPSIALMMEEQTDEPNGVEVKFAVTDPYECSKWREEAYIVYRYFNLLPNVSGVSDFKILPSDSYYETMNIIPGVHIYNSNHPSKSVAVMGNIAYPIQIPDSVKELGKLRELLGCGIEMNFEIGELDFQASREGLSYVSQTINSIKNKLEALVVRLADHIAEEADKIDNLWDRAFFLDSKLNSEIWRAAVDEYVKKNPIPTFDNIKNSWNRKTLFSFKVEDLENDFNIVLRCFRTPIGYKTTSVINDASRWTNRHTSIPERYWEIPVENTYRFVIQDIKRGTIENSRYHFRQDSNKNRVSHCVFVLLQKDPNKPMKTKEFFDAIHNPPERNKFLASALEKKPKKDVKLGKNVKTLRLDKKYWRRGRAPLRVTWNDAGNIENMDKSKTYYYLPLSGYQVMSKYGFSNAHALYPMFMRCGIPALDDITIYGVRKGDIDFIKRQNNWVNIEDYLSNLLVSVDERTINHLKYEIAENENWLSYKDYKTRLIKNKKSPYLLHVKQTEKGSRTARNYFDLDKAKNLCDIYVKDNINSYYSKLKNFVDDCATINKRYPLLKNISGADNIEVAEYINLIDSVKGV